MLTKPMAYEAWMGIDAAHQPPTLYCLLAIKEFESDPQAIKAAAKSRRIFIEPHLRGENSKVAAVILNELAHAQVVLLNPQAKTEYDAKLRLTSSSDATSQAELQARQTSVVRLAAAPGKSALPKARTLEPARAVPVAGQAAPSDVDIASIVSEAKAANAGKRQPKVRKPVNPVIMIAVGGAIATGLVVAGLIYLFSGPQNAPDGPSPGNSSQAAAARPHPSGRPAATSGKAPADSAGSQAKDSGKSPAGGRPPEPAPNDDRAKPYDEEHLNKDVAEIKNLSKAVKTPDDSHNVAEKALVLADRAIVLGKAETAKEIAVITLAAARNSESIPLARRATVLLIQLQGPLSDDLKQIAKGRLGSQPDEDLAALPERVAPSGPSLRTDDDSAGIASAPGSHDAHWGKTEAERRKIFSDLLKAVDDYGMTPQGRKAWKDIQALNGIDARVILGILNEGFNTFSNWEQPDGGGRASARMNRMQWIGQRTRSMSEPMLSD